MLTIAQLPINSIEDVSNEPVVAQNEMLPTDAEISRRVLRIRAGWSAEERVQRRRDAEQRFVDLLFKLAETDVAA